jgi:hypothetical protein
MASNIHRINFSGKPCRDWLIWFSARATAGGISTALCADFLLGHSNTIIGSGNSKNAHGQINPIRLAAALSIVAGALYDAI